MSIPAALRTKLKLRGDESATLFVTRIGAKRVAILADRVSPPRAGAESRRQPSRFARLAA